MWQMSETSKDNQVLTTQISMHVVGNWRMPVLVDLNERGISFEEVGEAGNEMKSGKAPGLDGFPVECLKKGAMAVLDWLVRLLNLSFDMGVCTYGLAWCLYSAPVQRKG